MKLSSNFFVAIGLAALLAAPFARAGTVDMTSNGSPTGQKIPVKITFTYDDNDVAFQNLYQILVGIIGKQQQGGTTSISDNPKDICRTIQSASAKNSYYFVPGTNNNDESIYDTFIANSSGTLKPDELDPSIGNVIDDTVETSQTGDLTVIAVLLRFEGIVSDSNFPSSPLNYSKIQKTVMDKVTSDPGGATCEHASDMVTLPYQVTGGKLTPGAATKTGSSASGPKATANTSVSGFGVVTSGPAETGGAFCDPKLAVQLGETTTAGKTTNLGTISFKAANLLGLCNTGPILGKIINVAAILASIAFIIAIIYSGIILITATSEDAAAKAKKNLTWAVIGAVIVILANWVVPEIINLIKLTLNA